MTQSEQKLVSVVVVSYHSAETVIETLDSIYAQTYPDIELILSDDGSKDDTVKIAQQWAENHKDRFVRCVIHANEKNLGVPDNFNTGIRLSTGYYLKCLAADDLLLPDCIAQMVARCDETGWDNLCARVIPFCIKNNEKVILDSFVIDETFFEMSSAQQHVETLVENRVCSPTFFMTRALFEEMGGYDSRFRLMEDYPMYAKLTKNGHQLHFLDAYTVEYRLSDNSLSNRTEGRIVNPGYHKTIRKFFYMIRLPGLLRNGKIKRVLGETRRFLLNDLILLFGNDRRRKIPAFLEKLRERSF